MTDWNRFRLSDVVELKKQTIIPTAQDSLPYIGLEHIEQQTLRLCGIGNSDSVTSQKFVFSSGDILFGKLRPYFRKVVRPRFDGICSTDIWVMRAKSGFSQGFVFYLVATEEFIETCNIGESGTRMPRADWNYIKDTSWIIPPLPEQQAIAEVLSSLDDKIDLLHRNNETLEEMATTLFRRIDYSSEVYQVSDIANHIKIPVNPFDRPDSMYFHYSLPAFDKAKTPELVTGSSILSNKYKVLANVTMISKLNPITPRVWYIHECEKDSVASTEFILLQAKDEKLKYYLHYLVKSQAFQSELISAASGTSGSHQRVSPDVIMKYSFEMPYDSALQSFNLVVEDIQKKLFHNNNQINVLSNARDLILPKLMYGALRVKDFTHELSVL